MFSFERIKKVVLFVLVFFVMSIFVMNAQGKGQNRETTFCSVEFNSHYYPQKAQRQIDSLKVNIPKDQISNYQGYFDLIHAQLMSQTSGADSVLNYMESAISFFTLHKNDLWLARCYFHMGEIAEVSGMFEQAKINFYDVISLIGNQHSEVVGLAYLGVGRCKNALQEKVDDEFSIGISVLEKSNRLEYRLYAEVMKAYKKLKDKDTPTNLLPIAKVYDDLGLLKRVVSTYKLIASSYKAQQKYDSAHYYCDKAISVCEYYKIGNQFLPALYQFKGVLYYSQKYYTDAKVFLLKSLDLYNENNQQNRSVYALNYLHEISYLENDYEKAYEYLSKYQYLNEKEASSEKVNQAKVLEINNKVSLLRRRLAKLKADRRASELFFYLIIIFITAVLGVVILYFINYQKRKKKLIDELNKEFNNLLMGIGEKQLLEHRLSIQNQQKVQMAFEKNQIPESDLGHSFDSCYMETINMFTESFPSLTKTEVRYAVMLCLKLPVEIIAKIQNVQPSSIRKAKQRIRTKLDISDNLDQYLQNYREKQISEVERRKNLPIN